MLCLGSRGFTLRTWSILFATSVLSGRGIAVFVALWESTLQLAVSPEALSRVATYDELGSYALIPVGYALAVILSVHLGNRGALAVSTIWTLVSSYVVFAPVSTRMIARLQIPR